MIPSVALKPIVAYNPKSQIHRTRSNPQSPSHSNPNHKSLTVLLPLDAEDANRHWIYGYAASYLLKALVRFFLNIFC
jgi:hypothetical protein